MCSTVTSLQCLAPHMMDRPYTVWLAWDPLVNLDLGWITLTSPFSSPTPPSTLAETGLTLRGWNMEVGRHRVDRGEVLDRLYNLLDRLPNRSVREG